MVETSGGGYAIAGGVNYYYDYWNPTLYDAWLVKTDANGNVEWNRIYGEGDEDVARSVIQTVDGGYAMAGRTQTTGSGNYDFWLIKTNVSGVPEFPSNMALVVLMLAVTLMAVLVKRKFRPSLSHGS